MLCGELFPDSVRIESGAVTISTNVIFGLICGFINDAILNATGEFGEMIFSTCMNIFAALVGFWLIPRNRSISYDNDNLL